MRNLFNKTDETTSCNDKDCPVILHISDLHFGRDKKPSDVRDRKLVLKLLADTLSKVENSWKPTYLCITGDIADTGSQNEYTKAKDWIESFCQTLEITINHTFMCPGNHDADLSAVKERKMPGSADEVDSSIDFPLPDNLTKPFANFIQFCDIIGVPAYRYTANNTSNSRLVGVFDTGEDIKFVCYNSCFYSWCEDAKGKLVLGTKLLDNMQSEGMLQTCPDHSETIIVLMHHPERKLDEAESHVFSTRPAAFNRLTEMSHLILVGDLHAEMGNWRRNGYGAYDCTLGSVFLGIDKPNCCQLIRIDKQNLCFECSYFHWVPNRRKWDIASYIETKWPFYVIDPSTEQAVNAAGDGSLFIKAEKLANNMWKAIQERDMPSKLMLLEEVNKFLSENRANIVDIELVKRLEYYLKEIELEVD